MKDIIQRRIEENIDVHRLLIGDDKLIENIIVLVDAIISIFMDGGKIIVCGNGGSASDSIHFVGEIVGRFQKERRAMPAIALNADVATLTSIANDYGYEDVFSRQVEAIVNPNDIFIGISTSGNSKNIIKATQTAKVKGAKTVALLGKGGGILKSQVDIPIIVPSDITARIQECHILIIHIICELIEERL